MNRLEKYYDPQVRNNILMLPPPPLIDSASSRTSTWTYKTTGFSLLDRGERIKPERSNRRNVQKMQWRNSRWVKSFPDGDYDYNELDSRISSMTIADVSPRFAVRRIILLYENFQYREAANFVNRLSHGTFKVIINDLPIDLFIESMPHSLSILEALYAKVFLSDGLNFSIKTLRPEGVVMQMVKFFSTQDEGINSSKWELCGPFICSCKKLLKVIVLSDPKIKKILNQRRRSLDKAIEGMGQHGLVGTSDETLMNLHDALKVEFQKVVETYKEALQKLEELSLANKTTVTRSISHGPAPIQASHQRQLSLRQEEIQERLIKNKTLLNVVEPSLGSNSLGILLGILQRRIEYDKDVLFQFSQLRKEVKNVDANSIVAPILMHYSHGCEAVLELMKEVAEDEDDSSDISGYHSDSDSAIMMSGNSPYISKRARYNFLTRSVRSGSKSSVRTSVLNSSSGISSGLNSGSASGSDSPSTEEKGDSPISTPTPTPSHIPTRPRQLKHKKELQKLNSAVSASSSSSGTIPCCQGCRPRASLQTLPPSNDQEVSILRAEMENLRAELSRAKNSVVTLQETEKRLKESVPCFLAMTSSVLLEKRNKLAAQAQKHLEFNGCRFENVGMGERRPTALIRRYGNLYAQARVDTLDALDNLTELKDAEELKSKILFSVVVLAFRSVQSTLLLKKEQVRKILHMPPPPPVQSQSSAAREADTVAAELERSIALYLRRTVDKYDLTKNIDEVLSQIWATLYDYPCLKSCEGLIQYVKDSVRLAWGLINQAPPFVLEYEQRIFRKDVHIRFHTSNQESQHIKTYLWPALLEGTSGPCVHKGVVIT